MNGGQLSGGAPIIAAYEDALASFFGSRYAVAVNSGSSALHAALVTVGAAPGSEVIVPAVAPLPTALPILTCGATPVIVDVLPGTLAIDPDDLRRAITSRTKAVIAVPLWGYPVDTSAAESILAESGIPLIEDAAQAHGSRLNGRFVGTHGVIGCFSTHDRKPLSTGEGGFILTSDPSLYERVEYYTRLGRLRGSHGVNYKLAAPLAAIGLHRLAHLGNHLAARARRAQRILDALPVGGWLRELEHPPGSTPNYYSLVLTSENPGNLAQQFANAGLPPDSVRYRYRPLYHQPVFRPYARACPHAEAVTTATFQLPVHPGLTSAQLEWTIRTVAHFANHGSEQT